MSKKTVAIANGVVDQQMTLNNSALARDILGSAPHRDLPEEESEWKVEELNWEPDLNPVQMEVYKDDTLHLLAHGEKGCLCTDSSFVYEETGLKRLGRMRPRSVVRGGFSPMHGRVVSFDDCSTNISCVTDWWEESDRAAKRIEFCNGSVLTTSPRHPVWCCWESPDGAVGFDYVRAEDFKLGWNYWVPFMGHPHWTRKEYVKIRWRSRPRRCAICGSNNRMSRGLCDACYQRCRDRGEKFDHWVEHDFVLDEAAAHAIGLLVAEGCLEIYKNPKRCRAVGFTSSDLECVESVRRLCDRLGSSFYSTNRYQWVSGRGGLVSVLKSLDLLHSAYDKRIPNAILESPKSVAAAFLSGLFDGDGYVSASTGYVGLDLSNERLVRDVQGLLSAFGILSVVRYRKPKVGCVRPSWYVLMMGKWAFKFGNEIGFRIARKQSRIVKKPKPSRLQPGGWRTNLYGYPKAITKVLKQFIRQYRKGKQSDAWHNKYRQYHQLKHIPGRRKVEWLLDQYGGQNELDPFLVSDNWLKIVSWNDTEADLADLRVENTHSFLANGLIHHNSGKSIGAMHKVVKHCYEEDNALALIITPSMRTGREGTAYELETLVLPHWTEGMGLEWKPFTTDAATKDRICWLGNKWGGWSKLLVMSIPYPEIVETRMKVMAPSIVFVDELTECKSRQYLTYPVLQLGRRRGIRGKQPFIAATNPAGPSHWVYEAFFVGGRDDSDFTTIHVPFSDNASRIPEGYKERLAKMLAYDPIAYKQLVHGEWIDRPSGEGMFSAQYQPSVHRIGDKSMGLAPSMGFPITVGLDLGDVWSSVVFMQGLPVERNGESTLMWKMFDELAYLNEKTTNKAIVGDIIERMDYWDDYADKKFMYDFWSDSSALIRWRPVGTGGYDATEIARYSENRIRLKPAPKFKGSIEARVRLVQQVLYDERFFVSHRCQHMHEVFLYLEKQEKFPMKPKRSKYIHSFDALGYALMGVEMNGQRRPLDEPMVEIVRLGRRR